MLATYTISLSTHAAPITDAVSPLGTYIAFGSTPSACPTGFDCGPGWLSFTHRITDDGFNLGDAITSATLVIHLGEVTTTGVNHEQYRYDIGTQTFGCASGNCVPNSGVLDTLALNASSLADLTTDGVLQVTINSLSGGFVFVDSLLSAEVSPYLVPANRSSVPVPPTLLLLGVGLMALGTARIACLRR
jgi:hypothetical protein